MIYLVFISIPLHLQDYCEKHMFNYDEQITTFKCMDFRLHLHSLLPTIDVFIFNDLHVILDFVTRGSMNPSIKFDIGSKAEQVPCPRGFRYFIIYT